MRVLTLTPFYPNALDDAVGCFVSDPLRVLEEHGVVSCVVATQPVYRGRMHSHPANPADWVYYAAVPGGMGLSFAGVFLYAGSIAKMRRLHRMQPFDVIHAHAALPCGHAGVLLSRELGIPCVVTVHGLDAFFANQVKGPAAKWCQRISQFVYRSASRVICISKKVSECVAGNAGALPNSAVVYNGVDAEVFSPAPGPRENLTILSVGNLIPIKGHELLLRAFAHIHRDHANVSCEIIGDGPERPRLINLVSDLRVASKVRFLGRQNRRQVIEAMRRCTIFALPSRYEGLGCAYLEAMSTEKPVIACREQGIAEIIQHGVNGWLVNPEDLSGLTDALSLLLRSAQLRQQTGAEARRTVRRNFTLKHQARQLAQLYRECVA